MATVADIQAESQQVHDALWKLREQLHRLQDSIEPHLPEDVAAEAMVHHMRPYSLAWEVHCNLTKALEHFDQLMDYLLGAYQDTEDECVARWLSACRNVPDEHLQRSLWALVGWCVLEYEGKYLEDLPLLQQLEAPQEPEALRALVRVLFERLWTEVGGGEGKEELS